jgi:hypothetical protein
VFSSQSLPIGAFHSIASSFISSLDPRVEYVKERINGVNVTSKSIHLFRPELKDANTFFEASRVSTATSVLNKLGARKPSWFDTQEYANESKLKFEQILSNDTELSKSLSLLQNSTLREKPQHENDALQSAVKRLEEIVSQIKVQQGWVYLRSDLPIDYFMTLNQANWLILDEMRLLIRKVAYLQGLTRIARIATVWQKAQITKSQFAPILAAATEFSQATNELEFYVDFCNADKMSDMFEYRPLKASRLATGDFNIYSARAQKSMSIFSSELVKLAGIGSSPELLEPTKVLMQSMGGLITG